MTTWVILRAAGIGAYLMVFLSVVWGLVSTTGALGRTISKASATTIHQFMATCGLFLLAIHLSGLLVDSFMPFGVADVLVPSLSSYRPAATAFGVIAMYAMMFVIVTSWMRKRIGTKLWRRSHLVAVPTFVLSMVHGVFAGSDSTRPWMWWTYVATGAMVVFLVVVRGLTAGYRPDRAERSPSRRSGSIEPSTRTEPRPSAQRAHPLRLLADPDVVPPLEWASLGSRFLGQAERPKGSPPPGVGRRSGPFGAKVIGSIEP
jgi:sulfoxide reductase heme-binding subunit YedZ